MWDLLSEWELNGLDKFLRSPFFNRNEAFPRFLHAYRQGHRTRPDLWHATFPAEPYHDARFRHLLSDLLRLTEDYLVQLQLRDRPELRRLHLLRALRQRSAGDLHQFTWRKFTRRGHPGPFGPDALLEVHLLHAEQNAWLDQRAQRSRESHLEPTLHSLDAYFIFTKLRHACIALNNRRVLDVRTDHTLLDEILAHLAQHTFPNQPGIDIYHRIYLLLTDADPGPHYEALKQLLNDHAAVFQAAEARTMYAFALNHCVQQINRGQSRFLREIFDLYQAGLQDEILLEDGKLSPWNYKNIVVAGLRLAEYPWTEQFIRDYRERIPEAYRDNAYTYNLAKLHFYRHDYGQVLQLLQRVEYEDVFYNLDSKVMLLKIYFELEEVEALDSLIETFRTYLRRNQEISSDHQRNYLNLIRFVKKLSRWRPGEKARLQRLEEEMRATQQLADADWLLRKVAEMKG